LWRELALAIRVAAAAWHRHLGVTTANLLRQPPYQQLATINMAYGGMAYVMASISRQQHGGNNVCVAA